MAVKPVLKRGMLEVEGQGLGKEEMLCMEIERKKLDLCAISEHRWRGYGEYKHGEHLFLYSGVPVENPKAEQGVALVLNKKMQAAWKTAGAEVHYVNSRIIVAKFRIKGVNLRTLAVYAPTCKAKAEVKIWGCI